MRTKRLLVFLDDEPNILKALSRIFIDDENFAMETFTAVEKALSFIKANPVQLIISDQRMPVMTGTEFFVKVRELRPEAIRILLTGYADLDATIDAINKGQIYKFLVKPWNDEEVHATVVRALEFYDLTLENKRLLQELSVKNEELAQWNKELGNRVKERTKMFVEKNLELNKLNKVLEISVINTIRVFVNLMRLFSKQLSGHCRRVASMSLTIAQKFNFSEEEMHEIEVASLLHDIGKLSLTRSLIEKPISHLSESEKNLLLEHPRLGQQTLETVERFKPIGEIIVSHHERWDGKGYPKGLVGESIPHAARLVAVCNVFDRLFNIERSFPRVSMKNYFKRNSGTMFDPQMCDAICEFIEQETRSVTTTRFAQVLPSELRPGMTLAADLQTGGGIFLLPHGQALRESHIESILEMHKIDPIEGMIRVFVPNI